MNRMRMQRVIQTGTPNDTATSIQKVEKAAADVTSDLDDVKANRFAPVSVTGGASHNAQPWDFVVASGSSYVYLPAPVAQLAGAEIAVVSADGSSISVRPSFGKIRGGSGFAHSAQSQVTLICDGTAWW